MRQLVVLLLFLAFPIAEIALFIVVGGQIGVLPTIGLMLLSIVAGGLILRVMGLKVLRGLQNASATGANAAPALGKAATTVLAALLLIIPGFLTDIIALALLVPAIRDRLWRLILARATIVTTRRGFRASSRSDGPFRRPAEPQVIDLEEDEFSRQGGKDDGTPPRRPPLDGQGL